MTNDNDLIRREVTRICQEWANQGMGDECFWEGWAGCPTQDAKLTPNDVLRALPAVTPAVAVKPQTGWIIGNGQGDMWRCAYVGKTNSEWTSDKSKALKFATREDAEVFSAEGEDAWLIQEVPLAALEPQPDPRDEVIARLGPIADLLPDAVAAAEKAMRKFPQPNYVISKWAEETGEVTKDLIHMAEGRQTVEKLRGEIVQSLAMLHRLLVEGDQVHGLPPIAVALAAAKVVQQKE